MWLYLYLILSLLAGVIAGTITGLIPGIHTNLVAVLLLSFSVFLLAHFPPLVIVIFIVSMAIAHTFLDFIPSIFLGAPDEDTALSVMPGHELLLKGDGHAAVLLTLVGSSLSLIILILVAPLFILTIPYIYPFIQRMMGWFLIWISIFLIFQERKSRLWAFLIFMLAGFLGLSTLNLSMQQPLLPLLTGLFGSSTLIYSISQKIILPKQKITKLNLTKKEIIKPAIATTLVSPICSFFPGLGSSQAAVIGSGITGKLTRKQFLILLGSVNTLVMSMSFVTLYLINKSRTGAANAISQIISISFKDLIYILVAIIFASIISILVAIKISKLFAKNIEKINYSKLSLAVLFILTALIIYFSGFLGLFVFAIATLLGLTCIYSGIRRGFLMGCLLIPTILFYLPF